MHRNKLIFIRKCISKGQTAKYIGNLSTFGTIEIFMNNFNEWTNYNNYLLHAKKL